MKRKKRMAFVDLTNYKDWPMGGMLEYELAILEHLIDSYELDIWGVSVNGKAEPFVEINSIKYPINIFGNAKTRGKLVPNYWRGLELIFHRNEFDKDYDVVYAHTGSCMVAIRYIVNHTKTRLVYHQHGLNHKVDFSFMSLIQRPGLRLAQKFADLVFVVSDKQAVKAYANEMAKKTSAKFVAIGSPINLKKFDFDYIEKRIDNRKNSQTMKFLYTGRLSAFKNVKTLVYAMRLYVKNVNPDAELLIIGSGGEYKNIAKIILECQLEKNVKLLGAIPHSKIYSLLKEADVFLTASGGEGVSVSVLEAFASGLPVVCFKVPGLEKQIISGKTGIIAKGESYENFYNAMIELDQIRSECARNCLKEAKKYDSKLITEKIIEEIEKL